MDNPKEKQLNIYVDASITNELIEAAKRENKLLAESGHSRAKVTKSGLAYDILIWGLHVYRKAHSLVELKKLKFEGFVEVAPDVAAKEILKLKGEVQNGDTRENPATNKRRKRGGNKAG